MRINRQEFQDILTQLKPGLSSRGFEQAHVCLKFYPDKITTFNEDIFVSVPLQSDLSGAIYANELIQLTSKLTHEEMEFSVQGNEIRLTCGRTRAGMFRVEGIRHPNVEPQGEWKPITDGFLKAIQGARFSTADSLEYPRWTCVHVRGNTVRSTDGRRASEVILPTPSPFDFLITRLAVPYLDKYNFTHMTMDDSWIHFTCRESGILFCVRQVEGEFIEDDKIESYLAPEGREISFPQQTRDTLERCLIVADKTVSSETAVKITVEPGMMLFRSQSAGGWLEEAVDIDYDDIKFKVQVNPNYLIDILRKATHYVIGERLYASGENFRHTLLLLDD